MTWASGPRLYELPNTLDGFSGNDTIYGRGGSDRIQDTRPGLDTVFSGEGDDWIRVVDRSGGDVVHCGEDLDGADNDTVYYDPDDEVAADCETQRPMQ